MRKAISGIFVLFAFIIGVQDRALCSDVPGLFPSWSAENLIVNRPVNIQGLTGLLFTNSAYTQPAGSVTLGISGLGERNSDLNYSLAQGTASLTVGITSRIEAGVRGKMFGLKTGGFTDEVTERTKGMGDTDVLLKWRVSSQGAVVPALALGVGWTFPNGNDEKGLSEVKRESVKLMLMATGENRVLTNSFFVGIYLEAQAIYNDELHDNRENLNKDRYGAANAGILFPLTHENNLQFLFEYTAVFNRDLVFLNDGNYTGLVPGLRFVTDDFNFTLGFQRIKREDASDPSGHRRSSRFAGTIGYRF